MAVESAKSVVVDYKIKKFENKLYPYKIYEELDERIRYVSTWIEDFCYIHRVIDKTLKWSYNNMGTFNENGRVLAEECVEILCLLRVCNDNATIKEWQERIIELLKQIKM